MTATHIATNVWNDTTGTYERIDIEPITHDVERDLSNAEVSAEDIGGQPGQRVRIELLDALVDTIDSTEITATGDTGATTYAAHIVTADAEALGDPEVIVMTDADEASAAEPVAHYPLSDGQDPIDVLQENGWRIIGDATEVETGYMIIHVQADDPVKIVEHVTSAKKAADIEAQRQDGAWRTIIRDAMHDGASATKLAAAAEISRERVYQIRDGRR